MINIYIQHHSVAVQMAEYFCEDKEKMHSLYVFATMPPCTFDAVLAKISRELNSYINILLKRIPMRSLRQKLPTRLFALS